MKPRRLRLDLNRSGQAAVAVEIDHQLFGCAGRSSWRDLEGEQLCLKIGLHTFPSTLLTCRPEDRCIGATHWLEFALDRAGRDSLAGRITTIDLGPLLLREIAQLRFLAESDVESKMPLDQLAQTVIERERKRMGIDFSQDVLRRAGRS